MGTDGSRYPGDDGDDVLPPGRGGAERGQQITVEWGPYLGYGGGSGV